MDDSQFDVHLADLLANHPGENEFADLCALYRGGTSAQRARFRVAVRPTFGWAMPDRYALATNEVAPVVAERRLRDLLTWSAVFPSGDSRDDLVAIAPLYHAAVRLSLDALALFDEVADIAETPAGAGLIRKFPRRRPELKSLSAFLLKEIPTPQGGVRYIHEA